MQGKWETVRKPKLRIFIKENAYEKIKSTPQQKYARNLIMTNIGFPTLFIHSKIDCGQISAASSIFFLSWSAVNLSISSPFLCYRLLSRQSRYIQFQSPSKLNSTESDWQKLYIFKYFWCTLVVWEFFTDKQRKQKTTTFQINKLIYKNERSNVLN